MSRRSTIGPGRRGWFARRTWQAPGWTVAELVAAKAGGGCPWCSPRCDEEATVGAVVAAIVAADAGPRPWSTSWS